MISHERQQSQPEDNRPRAGQGRPTDDQRFWRDPLVGLLLVIALFLRVAYNLALDPNHLDWYSFVIDEREYFGAAHMFAEGRGFSFFDTALWVRPPLYVAMLGALLRLGESSYLPVLVVQSVLSTVSLLPLGLLAYRHGGRAAARWCIALGAIYLPFTLFSGLLLSETLFVFLLSWALFALDRVVSQLPSAGSRSGLNWLGFAGVLLGLATLTRATALALVPLTALWIFLNLRKRANTTSMRSLALAGVVLVVPILMLIPWTARNWVAYGRFIPVDTTSGYNLWLGSVGVRDEERLQADLLTIENPADRQAFALARGWENITRDPMSFFGKGIKESLDLWRPLFSAEERQVRGYTSGRVPAWHLVSLLVFDDLLYVLILLAAVLGLLFSGEAAVEPAPLRSLTLLWLAIWMAIAFVFFAVTRFRLPVVAVLLPWAAIGIAHLSASSRVGRVFKQSSHGQRFGLGGAFLLVAVVVLPAVPLQDTLLGIQRWEAQAPFRRGEDLLKAGQVSEAIVEYEKASREVTDTRYALAAAYLQVGDTQKALGELVQDEPPRRFEPFLIRGEAVRISGDLEAARSFFNERTVNLAGDEALRWAWDHLAPPPAKAVELGSGLDVGYIRGFHSAEADGERRFRWTSARMEVRGLELSGATGVTLELSGWRPEQLPAARLRIDAPGTVEPESGGEFMITLPKDAIWTTEVIPVGTRGFESGPIAHLYASVNPFVGSGRDPRLLGVRITRITVGP